MKKLLIIALIITTVSSRAQVPPVIIYGASLSENYVVPDPGFFEEIDISHFKGNSLTRLLEELQVQVTPQLIGFVYSPDLADCYHVSVRKKKGVLLEILQDALRDTDLQIIVFPPKAVGIHRPKNNAL